MEELQRLLGCHSVRLVYTPANLPGWKPWQVIARWPDGSERFFSICHTADQALQNALATARSKKE